MAPPLPPAGPETIRARFAILFPDNTPIRGMRAIARAVSRLLDTSCSLQTAERLASPENAGRRLPVWKWAFTRKVFMLPEHLLCWAVLELVPHGATPPKGRLLHPPKKTPRAA